MYKGNKVIEWREPYVRKVFTTVLVRRNENEILLGHRQDAFGVRMWDGFGGEVEEGESLMEAAQRGLYQETNLRSDHLERVGVVKYGEMNRDNIIHVFKTEEFEGEEKPTVLVNRIQWFKCTKMPFDQMTPDTQLWYPCLFDDPQYFCTDVQYARNGVGAIRMSKMTRDDFESTMV